MLSVVVLSVSFPAGALCLWLEMRRSSRELAERLDRLYRRRRV